MKVKGQPMRMNSFFILCIPWELTQRPIYDSIIFEKWETLEYSVLIGMHHGSGIDVVEEEQRLLKVRAYVFQMKHA